MVHSNAKGVPMVPFVSEFLYLTIDCKDSDLLEEVCLTIKASLLDHKKKRPQGQKHEDAPEIDTSGLTDYYN